MLMKKMKNVWVYSEAQRWTHHACARFRRSLWACGEVSVRRRLSPDLQREGKHPAVKASFISALIKPSFCVMYHTQLLCPYMMFTSIKICPLMGDECKNLFADNSCWTAVGLSLYTSTFSNATNSTFISLKIFHWLHQGPSKKRLTSNYTSKI